MDDAKKGTCESRSVTLIATPKLPFCNVWSFHVKSTLLHYLITFTWLDYNSSLQYLTTTFTGLHYSTAVLKEASLLHFITELFTLLHYLTTLLHFIAWWITLLHCLATLCHFMSCVTYAHYLTWLHYCTTARSDRDRKLSLRRPHPRSVGGTQRWEKIHVVAYLVSIQKLCKLNTCWTTSA